MWRYIGLALVGIVVVVSGFSLLDVSGGGDVGAAAVLESAEISTDNYRAVDNPNYEWNFPADHGPHEDYLTEWWYYTGNVATEDGRRFGFQFTVFRRAILPDEPEQDSEWRSRQIYNGHVTISDFETEVFFKEERFGRGAAGLAGATADPRYRVWLEDWEVIALNDDATEIRMTATVEDAAFDLTLTRVKPIVLQGEDRNGLSSKGGEASNASYYYSITRMETAGTITIEGTTYDVSGLSWMDHEFSTGALPEGTRGWDWFGLIFDDTTEVMLAQVRAEEGAGEGTMFGMFVDENSESYYLPVGAFQMEPLDSWTSPQSGATYPLGWDITIDGDYIQREESLTFQVIPLMAEQELNTDPTYWEGAVRVEGDVTGYGYNEMTGYADSVDGRF